MDDETLKKEFENDLYCAGAAHKIKEFCWIYYKKTHDLIHLSVRMKNELENVKYHIECEGVSAGSSDIYSSICEVLKAYNEMV